MIYNQEQLKNRFFCTFTIFLISAILWRLSPLLSFIEHVDSAVYYFFNSLLQASGIWTKFVGFINHKSESWLNLVFMLIINAIVVMQAKSSARRVRIWQTVYFWFFFQVVLLLTHLIFQDILDIRRLSPSIAHQDTHNSINILLSSSDIKETSSSSFPAGHTLVAIYWCLFTMKLNPSYFAKIMILLTSILLCCNRLFTGAHWLTDILFTINLGYFFHYLSCHPFLYRISDLTIKDAVAFHPKP